jgi:hypothetical protein
VPGGSSTARAFEALTVRGVVRFDTVLAATTARFAGLSNTCPTAEVPEAKDFERNI